MKTKANEYQCIIADNYVYDIKFASFLFVISALHQGWLNMLEYGNFLRIFLSRFCLQYLALDEVVPMVWVLRKIYIHLQRREKEYINT